MKIFELYLDESGEFADDSLSEGSSPSLVGGLLCEAGSGIPDLLQNKITRPIHATEEYDKSFLSLLQSLWLDVVTDYPYHWRPSNHLSLVAC